MSAFSIRIAEVRPHATNRFTGTARARSINRKAATTRVRSRALDPRMVTLVSTITVTAEAGAVNGADASIAVRVCAARETTHCKKAGSTDT